MDVVLKIAGWGLFLLAYVAYAFAAHRLQKASQQRLGAGESTFWVTQGQTILGVVALFGFIFLLTGFLDLPFVGLFLLAAELAVVLRAIVSPLLRSPQSHSDKLIYWIGFDIGTRNGWVVIVPLVIATLALVFYPIAASVVYFTTPAQDLGLEIVRLTLLVLGVAGYVVILPMRIAILVSPWLDEDTRTRVLVASTGALMSTALYLGLGYWAFGFHVEGAGLGAGDVPLAISVELVVVLIVFFLVSVLIPYLIGVRLGGSRRSDFLDRQKRWLNEIARTLRVLGGRTYSAELEALQERLDMDEAEIAESSAAIGMVEDEPDDANDAWLALHASYQVAQKMDSRLTYRDSLRTLARDVSGIAAEMRQRRTRAAREKLAEAWSQVLTDRRNEVEAAFGRTSQSTSKAGLTIAIGTAALTVVVEEVTKWAWQNMSLTLPT